MFAAGGHGQNTIFGIPQFFILFSYTFLLWIVDFKSVKKYYNKSLLYFILIGLYYVLISIVGGFSLLFDVSLDRQYIFRQAYFIPFLCIAIPVFIRSFKFGIFNYFLKNKTLFIITSYFLFPVVCLYTAILLFSIKNHFIGFIIFLATTIIIPKEPEINLQILLMQGFLLFYFISKIRLNIKFITLFIMVLIFTGYFIKNEIILFVTTIDGNAGWRLMAWVHNIQSTINDTFLFGHGFGTSYFSSGGSNPGDFIQLFASRSVERHGSNYITAFLQGQHNSFINIFYRLGIIGLLIFLAYFKNIAKQIKIICAPHQLNYILLLGMIIIGVNVGLESPGYATQFVFLISLVQYFIYENIKRNTIN